MYLLKSRTVDCKSNFSYIFLIILQYIKLKIYPEYGGKDGMHIVINKYNYVINISHNHTERDEKCEADLSNFGKLDTVK